MDELLERFVHQFPELGLDRSFCRALIAVGQRISLPAGQHICLEGATCSHLAFVLQGTGRIYKLGESGREITLYRVEAGECCILTLSCIISERRFPAFAISESDVEAVIVSAANIQQWMDSVPGWRRYAWNLIAARLGDVIGLVEEVTFRRMDERLEHYLARTELFPLKQKVKITHQQIAADLGTSREVVSRLLKDLEQRNLLKLGRGWLIVQASDWRTDISHQGNVT